MIADPLGGLAAVLGAGGGAPAAVPRELGADQWDPVLEVAGALDLMPALWSAARRIGLIEPVPSRLVEVLGRADSPRRHPAAVLEQAHRANAGRNRDLLDQLAEVAGDLGSAGISLVALKGSAHLLAGTWPDPADRVMADLDLVVPPARAAEAQARLERLGYVTSEHPTEAGGGHHHLAPVRHPDRFGSIELHVEALARGWRPALGAADLVEQATWIEWRGSRVGLPAPAHTAVISLVHAYLADGARYQGWIPLRTVHELWCYHRRVGPLPWDQVRADLARIGWPTLVDDLAVTVEVLLGDEEVRRSMAGSRSGQAAARARLSWAATRRARPSVARALDPALRVRHGLDVGRLQRHYGTEAGTGWTLRLHHLRRQLRRALGAGAGS